MNRTDHLTNGGSLEITRTVPLKGHIFNCFTIVTITSQLLSHNFFHFRFLEELAQQVLKKQLDHLWLDKVLKGVMWFFHSSLESFVHNPFNISN